MAPYRTSSRNVPADAPRDTGIVGDIIGQFADPLAFYRELVQNSIDAGSPAIEIELTYDGRAARVAVKDRGEGMTRDTLENQLLVLFRSTKERDPDKIGKFGIGFASVLAADPEVVVVHSARDGRRLALHLHRDLTFDLFDAGPATQAGTTVELELPMPIDQARELARRSHAALTRWCRHATVPIQFEARFDGLAEPLSARIDRPLALEDALVEVRGTTPDGRLTAVVGFTDPPVAYAGFFNHGLMLWETGDALLGPLQLKIQDSRLGHTISRDNVRRDDHFTRALAFARDLAERELPQAASRMLRSRADAGEHDRHAALALAIQRSRIDLPAAGWWWPLAEPLADKRSIDLGSLGSSAWAGRRTRLAAALAARGVPVLHVHASDLRWTTDLLHAVAGARLADPDLALVHVTPVELTPGDHALVTAVRELLEACHRAPRRLVLARLDGVHGDRHAIAGGPEDAIHVEGEPGEATAWVLEDEVTRKNPFAWLRPRSLVLSAAHPLVRHARGADDPILAASHLTRAVLMQLGLLDPARSTTLLDRTLDRLGISRGDG